MNPDRCRSFSELIDTHLPVALTRRMYIYIYIYMRRKLDVVEERGQGFDAVVTHVRELDDELLAEFVVDNGHVQRRRLVREERTVVGGLQVQL